MEVGDSVRGLDRERNRRGNWAPDRKPGSRCNDRWRVEIASTASVEDAVTARSRKARLQYAVAGDVLESSLARVNASFAAATPSELMNKQTELHTQLVEKLRDRAQEFSTVTSEIQAKFSQMGNEIAAKAVHARKAA